MNDRERFIWRRGVAGYGVATAVVVTCIETILEQGDTSHGDMVLNLIINIILFGLIGGYIGGAIVWKRTNRS
jgi:hypothetical protein